MLLELCELGDRSTLKTLTADQKHAASALDVTPMALLLFLLRQSLAYNDKKACCAVGTLLLWCVALRCVAFSLLSLALSMDT